jgi:hypothetical protein
MIFEDQTGLRKVFDLQSPHQMLEKLRWETDLIHSMLVNDSKVIFAAFNGAATAWHIAEWIIEIWNELPPQNLTKEKYRSDVVSRCPELEICRQISVGWKHRVVKVRNDPTVQASHMVKLHVRREDGRIVNEGRPARVEISPVIFVGTKHFELDKFFDHLTSFWSDELARLGVNPAFTVVSNHLGGT